MVIVSISSTLRCKLQTVFVAFPSNHASHLLQTDFISEADINQKLFLKMKYVTHNFSLLAYRNTHTQYAGMQKGGLKSFSIGTFPKI